MSGRVLLTADDITMPEDDLVTAASALPSHNPRIRCLSFSQLTALVVVFILSFTGMVPVEDAAFVLSSLPYLYFVSSFVFPSLSRQSDPPIFGNQNNLLSNYVIVGSQVGLWFPIVYIFHGVVKGDQEGIKAAAPHVFLLACQEFLEGVAFTWAFSLPMRVFVQVYYNWKRLITICDWITQIAEDEREHETMTRFYLASVLAVVNLVFWSFNLFGFLLPVCLPLAFKRYYQWEVKERLIICLGFQILLIFVISSYLCVRDS